MRNNNIGIAQDPAARADITQRRQAGESLASIGKSYGVTRERIRQLCTKWGVESSVDLTKADPALVTKALELLQQGETVLAAAEQVGLNPTTVSRHATKQGIDIQAIARERSAHLYDGKTFGSWRVVPGSHRKIKGTYDDRELECICTCGERRWVRLSNLLAGKSRGCGCRNSTGQRQRVPWVCKATGERFPTTAALARHLGIDYMSLVRFLVRGEAYTDSTGHVWDADLEAAVPHVATPWICIQTREQWSGAKVLAAHLRVATGSLTQAVAAGRAYPAADGLHYCPVDREGDLEVRPRHNNANNASTPQSWICEQTGQEWSSRGQLEKHLGLGEKGLARKGSTYTAADGLTYRRGEVGE